MCTENRPRIHAADRIEVGQQSEISVLGSQGACSRKSAGLPCWRPLPRTWPIHLCLRESSSVKGLESRWGWPSFGGNGQIVSIVPEDASNLRAP